MKAKHGWLLNAACLSFLVLVITACGRKEAEARLTPLPGDAVVLIYAAGIGEEADFFRSVAMDDMLAKTLKRKVVSMGQAGEFSNGALRRLPAVLEQHDPDLMILGYGAMDLWKMKDRAALKTNLEAMIDLAHKRNTQVVMLGMPDINKLRVKIDPIFEEVAREKKVPIENEIVRTVLKNPSERIYRYMVNDQGIESMAKAVRTLCVKCGGLEK